MDDQSNSTTTKNNSNSGQLETSKAERAVWLMKCPPVVSRSLQCPPPSSDAFDSSRPVAKVVVSIDPLRSNDDSSSRQDALVKSNEVFETFKQEIDKMAKSIKELKKENTFLKSKCEKSDITLVELVEEREHLKKQLEKTRNQKEKLESLCRSLQAERKQNSIVGEQTMIQ